MKERGLNGLEVAVSVVSATLWALVPAARVVRAQRFGQGELLVELERWFTVRLLPLPVSVFLTVFVVLLSAHLFVASWRVPRERLERGVIERLALLAVLVVSLACLLVSDWQVVLWRAE